MIAGGANLSMLAPADSARVVAAVYTASLLVALPLVLAAAGALLLRRASAAARVLVWRSATAALLLVFAGRQLPLHWMAWVVPAALATPLVALGRVEVSAAPGVAAGSGSVVTLVLAGYITGAALVLLPTLLASVRMRRLLRRARDVESLAWRRDLDDARARFGVARAVRLVVTGEIAVPMTWGWYHPVIAVPPAAMGWTDAQRRMMLGHELAHVRAGDWAFGLASRVACALYWFHPGAWWISRALRDDAEQASDERVIAAGARRSDYAELLVEAADRLLPAPAVALSRRRGLRGRLTAILDPSRSVAPLARGWMLAAALLTLGVAGPMSAVQLAPTRDVLTTLMRDSRWESRAYAVIGLARRADSLAVARAAAERDPDPQVRAWARFALHQDDGARLRAVLHQ